MGCVGRPQSESIHSSPPEQFASSEHSRGHWTSQKQYPEQHMPFTHCELSRQATQIPQKINTRPSKSDQAFISNQTGLLGSKTNLELINSDWIPNSLNSQKTNSAVRFSETQEVNVNCSSTSPEATLELKVFLAVQWFLQTVNFKYDLNRKAIRREGMINAKFLKLGIWECIADGVKWI